MPGVYSMDLDEYIEAMFGKGCNEKNYRHYLESPSCTTLTLSP